MGFQPKTILAACANLATVTFDTTGLGSGGISWSAANSKNGKNWAVNRCSRVLMEGMRARGFPCCPHGHLPCQPWATPSPTVRSGLILALMPSLMIP
jgi:hypothetical protein